MKRRSKAIIVLLLSLCSITMTVAGCEHLLCYVDYIDTLTCKYNNGKDGTSVNLNSSAVDWTLEEENENCELTASGGKHEYTCTIDMKDFTFDTECTIFINASINGNDILIQNCEPFIIGKKFKPRAPLNLTVSFSENYNFSWRTLYDSDTYRSNTLAYELSYKKYAESWLNQKTVQVYEDEKSLVLLRSLFEDGEMYVARIRAQPKTLYAGHWGSWSTPVSWRTPADLISTENALKKWLIIIMVLCSLSVAIIVVACKWPKCLWKNEWVFIPDPASFFKPLYMVHHGDFKSWLGSSYYQATPFDSMAFPEIFEVYSQSLLKNASKQDLNSLEKQKFLLTKPSPSRDNQKCRKCDCNKAVLDKVSENLPMGTQPCPHFNTRGDGLEAAMDKSGDDSYPCVNLDSDSSKLLNPMLDQISDSQAATNFSAHSNVRLHEGFLGPNISILDLVPASPEGWEFQDSPSHDDDENVFYNDNYNAFSPDSGDSADFGYPRICLDLDTIDSGFCDSECGSPVDSDFGNKDTLPKPLSSDTREEETYERNYVKQWVPSHSVLAESITKNLTE
ncbi:interleukin-21 receptor [Rana temporaria]|uniref:interleukin-21 receptor n=1 Tax=Rana temporaria TaxID=8407 RepID=UPI001AACB70E|nr:interleukin-21 receptor [Rana temporaria]